MNAASHDVQDYRRTVLRHGTRVGLLLATLAGILAVGLKLRHGHARSTHPANRPTVRTVSAFRARRTHPARTYLKGQTHLHSSNSPDSRTTPVDVAHWYAAHGYDFIVFTDHNVVTRPPRVTGLLTFAGTELTQNVRACSPPPEPGHKCLAHLNALFAPPFRTRIRWSPPEDRDRLAIYQRAIDRADALGALTQLNHPNWAHTADARIVSELASRGVSLFEVMNGAVDAPDERDDEPRSLEAMWDTALTAGHTLYGVATDDAHQYEASARAQARARIRERARARIAHRAVRPQRSWTGDRGFVMVHAERNEASIRDALRQGDFYASSGVYLDHAESDGESLYVQVADRSPGSHHFRFVGAGGETLAESDGREAEFPLASAAHGYVRAVVTDAHGHAAWVQPVRVP